jgi:hypothetical protein
MKGRLGAAETPIKFRGETWWIAWPDSGRLVVNEYQIFTPDGRHISRRDAPFHLRSGKDWKEVEIWTRRPFALRSAEMEQRRYVYLIDYEEFEERLGIVNQDVAGAAFVPLGSRPQGIAASRDGTRVYVSHLSVAPGHPILAVAPPRISIIDTVGRSVIATVPLAADATPDGLELSPDGRYLYIANRGVFVVGPGTSGASVMVFDTQSRTVVANIGLPVGASVDRLALTPDGTLLYAATTQSFPARIFPIDTLTRTAGTFFLAPAALRDILVDHTGTRLYVLTQDTVVVYDTATNLELARTLVRANARLNALTLSLDGRVLSVNDQRAPSILRLDTRFLSPMGEWTVPAPPMDFSVIFTVP